MTLSSRVAGLRSRPLFNPTALLERWQERRGYEVGPHRPHLESAIAWLCAAQDATPDDGFARGFSITYIPYFGGAGWQASYPETTGYIIPTMFEAARRLDRPDLAERAVRAAHWEIAVQLESGAVQGGVIGQGRSPAVFNTGQVILGWLSALEETGDPAFAEAARRAGRYLVEVIHEDGHWRKGNSQFARAETTLYNARVAWALAEAGARLGEQSFRDAAGRNLRAVATAQAANGWFPDCCLTDPVRPLLHTIAYTVRGLIEGGRVLEDPALVEAGARAARALLSRVRADGWMPGRFNRDWSAAADWSCLTGEVQMVNNWIRLYQATGDKSWLTPVPRILGFLKSTQNRRSDVDGIRGGIRGSFPLDGEYGRYEVLNWATKYFADALMRDDMVIRGVPSARPTSYSLA